MMDISFAKNIKYVFILAAALIHFSSQAESPRMVDVSGFDVAGVKVGMNYDQALAAAAAHFKVERNQIKPGPAMENVVTGTKLPKWFSYEENGKKLSVHFEGRVPPEKKHPLVVSQVIYEMPWTKQNEDAMLKSAIEKYGPPTREMLGGPPRWCEKFDPENLGLGCSGVEQPFLELAGTKLFLVDQKRIQDVMRFRDAKNSKTPNF